MSTSPGLRWVAALVLTLPAGACTRQAAKVPSGPEQSRTPVVTFTPEAVRQVFRYRDLHRVQGPWRLRIEVREQPGGTAKHLVDLDLDPASPDDYEYDFEGIRVVVARSQISRLRGSTVGYHAGPDREGFFVSNPNLPAHEGE
jgi:Fe-S cluster assembly iron-binding protein IscA